ncbi:MAG: hypothetical protein ACI8XB_000426, partial [Patiriisocius sp.]
EKILKLSFPERRIMAKAPIPDGVERAQMVSFTSGRFINDKLNVQS